MTDKSQSIPFSRDSLGFVEAVRERFGFLVRLGFREVEALPTYVRYKRGTIDAAVFHGRSSYEIGFEAGVGQPYSLSEMMRLADPAAASTYKHASAHTPDALRQGLDQLALLVQLYARPALSGDEAMLGQLAAQRRQWAEDYALDVLVEQTRPKAEAAFREKRYADAVELLEKMLGRLTLVEQQKLEFARNHRG